MSRSTFMDNQGTQTSNSAAPAPTSQPECKVSVNDGNSNDRRPSTGHSSRLKSPRTPRFSEDTSVVSPLEPSPRRTFADPAPTMTGSESNTTAAHDISDVGFGYVADNRTSAHASFPGTPQNAALRSNSPKSPLKSALKSPGTAEKNGNPLSPTFREEQILEIHEEKTEEENAKDVKVKTRVRIAKFFLRGVNFSCSLIILVLVAQSFVIFNATKNLATRSGLSPWAPDTNPWPQILVLVIASISLLLAIGVIYGYARGGHRRAEKVGVYYTIFAAVLFTVTLVVWVVLAAVFQNSKSSSDGHDLWGWACKDNQRATFFEDDVPYELVCRMQDWILICIIIEIVVDVMTVAIYAVIFYRFYSKRKLRKTMDARDKARSDLYLANLRTQTAPNTPGFPGSPRTPASPQMKQNPYGVTEYYAETPSTQYATPQSPATVLTTSRRPFQLQPPPPRVQSHTSTDSVDDSISPAPAPAPVTPGPSEHVNEHMGAAPGEKTYGSVPVPGAYSSPLASPSFAPQRQSQQSTQQQQQQQEHQENEPTTNYGTAVTTNRVVESRAS